MAKIRDYKNAKYGIYPSDRIDPSLKNDKEWYIEHLSAMLHYHVTNRNEIPFEFSGDAVSIAVRRKYATGNQGNVSVKRKLLKEIGNSGTFITKLKDVFQTYDILPELYDVIRAINQKQDYDVISVAIDDPSIEEKDIERGMAKYLLQEQTKELLQVSGFKPQSSLSPEDLAFMTEADVDSLFDTGGYQLQREIAAIAACDYTKMISGHKEIENLCNDDLITLAISSVKSYIDYSTMEVKYRYVDPANLVVPHSKHNDFRDVTRAGELRKITIAEAKEMNPNIPKDKWEEIIENNRHINAKYFSLIDDLGDYQSPYGGDPMDQCEIWVLDAEWLSANYETHLDTRNSIGGKLYKPVKHDYKLNSREERKGAKLDKKRFITLHEAVWVVGSDILLRHGEVKDKVYYGPNGNKTPRLSYFVYKTGNKSLIERCMPHVDDINFYNTKLRISVASLPPAPRMVIQQEMLNNVKLNNIKQQPEDLIQTMVERGYLIVNGTDDHGRPIYQNGKAIDFLQTGLAEDVNIYSGLINDAINRLRQVLGLPEGLDGTAGNPYQGLGKQEMAAASSSNALFPTLGRISPLFSAVNEDVVKKWQQLAKDKKLKVKYKPLGEKNMKILELSKDFSNADFKTEIMVAPTDEQKQFLINTLVEMANDFKSSDGTVGASRAEFLMVYKLIQSGRIDMAMYRIAQIEKRREIANMKRKQDDIAANAEVQKESAMTAAQEARDTAVFVENEKRKTAILTEAQKRKTRLSETQLASYERENAPIPENIYEAMMADADEEIAVSMMQEQEQNQPQGMEEEAMMMG